jgi:hypothetical protein
MSMLFSEAAAPATPATGKVALYAKTDGHVYSKDDAGTETAFAGITLGTSVTASGTSVDFTSIPSGTKKITISFSGVSTNGTSLVLMQIGDSGGVENTGYLGSSIQTTNGAAVAGSTLSAGFIVCQAANAGAIRHGSITLSLLDSSTNTWAASGVIGRSDSASSTQLGASKSLSATLDRVRMTTVNGTDTFDAGLLNILLE